LPNIEDIYDIPTHALAVIEEHLASKGKGQLTAKEAKIHELIKVELGERRGVEEIGEHEPHHWDHHHGRSEVPMSLPGQVTQLAKQVAEMAHPTEVTHRGNASQGCLSCCHNNECDRAYENHYAGQCCNTNPVTCCPFFATCQANGCMRKPQQGGYGNRDYQAQVGVVPVQVVSDAWGLHVVQWGKKAPTTTPAPTTTTATTPAYFRRIPNGKSCHEYGLRAIADMGTCQAAAAHWGPLVSDLEVRRTPSHIEGPEGCYYLTRAFPPWIRNTGDLRAFLLHDNQLSGSHPVHEGFWLNGNPGSEGRGAALPTAGLAREPVCTVRLGCRVVTVEPYTEDCFFHRPEAGPRVELADGPVPVAAAPPILGGSLVLLTEFPDSANGARGLSSLALPSAAAAALALSLARV